MSKPDSGFPGVSWVERDCSWRAVQRSDGVVVHIKTSKFPEVCYIAWLNWMRANKPEGLQGIDLPPEPDLRAIQGNVQMPVASSPEMQEVVRRAGLLDWVRAREWCAWKRRWETPEEAAAYVSRLRDRKVSWRETTL